MFISGKEIDIQSVVFGINNEATLKSKGSEETIEASRVKGVLATLTPAEGEGAEAAGTKAAVEGNEPSTKSRLRKKSAAGRT